MANTDGLTPSVLVAKIRENQNNNKTLKSLFATQFLGKFSNEELDGLLKSISSELDKREDAIIKEKIEYLQSKGFQVSK
jgi:hypothetical protein